MSNECCLWGDEADYEPVELFSSKLVRPRAERKCIECGKEIKKGGSAIYDTGKYGGKWESFYTCLPCQEIKDKFFCKVAPWYSNMFSEISCELADNKSCIASLILELTGAAKDKLSSELGNTQNSGDTYERIKRI